MNKKKHLLFIVNSLNFGGAEKHTISLLNNLDLDKFTISLVCLKQGDSLLAQLDFRRLKAFFTCHVKFKIDFSAVRKISKCILDEQVDVVVCTNQYSMLYGLLAKRKSGNSVKVVEVFHSTLPKGLKDNFQWLFYKHLFNCCDHIVFVSENQSRYWKEDRGMDTRQISVIQNGIETDHFIKYNLPKEKRQELLKEHAIQPHALLIGICAVLRPEKKHIDLIQAIYQLRCQGVDAGLLIIGDGVERQNIADYVTTLPSMNNSVYFVGFQEDVRPFVELCHCMVIASHSIETFSISALESMAMGKPMILTDIGGSSEQIIHEQNGFLYQPGDIDALVRYLEKLIDPVCRKAMGSMSIKMVNEKFTVGRMVDKFEILFARTV